MKRLLLLIAISLLCTATLSVAGKIYKWTDSEGNVHYGERPPNGQSEQMQVPKAPPSSGQAGSTSNSQTNNPQNLLDAFEKERKEKAEATAKAEKEKAVRATNCTNARKRVAAFSIGGRIYDVTEQGERRYLEDAEIKSNLAEAQKAVEQWCD